MGKITENQIEETINKNAPTNEDLVTAVVTAGATAEQAAAASTSITELNNDGAASAATALTVMLGTSPNGNDYLTEFNNAIVQRWNDVHSDETIYDRFKKTAEAPTLQAVAYEKLAPIDFTYETETSDLSTDEKCFTRKTPAVHSLLKSINVSQRYKVTTSKLEIDKIQDGQSVSVNDVVANLGTSYADDRVDAFVSLVNGIEDAKSGHVVNAMTTQAEIAEFLQTLKMYAFKFREKRTDKYNAYVNPTDPKAKADTRLDLQFRPICLINPATLYAIEGDYYATLFNMQRAVPEVDFVLVDGMTNNKFAILIDPRVIEWSVYYYALRSEQICGRPAGDLNHYLFCQEIMGSWSCFNRMIFYTAEPPVSQARKRSKAKAVK